MERLHNVWSQKIIWLSWHSSVWLLTSQLCIRLEVESTQEDQLPDTLPGSKEGTIMAWPRVEAVRWEKANGQKASGGSTRSFDMIWMIKGNSLILCPTRDLGSAACVVPGPGLAHNQHSKFAEWIVLLILVTTVTTWTQVRVANYLWFFIPLKCYCQLHCIGYSI
jgi:hypothetical protein